MESRASGILGTSPEMVTVVVETGLVMVKTMAKGKHRSRAQMRESGVGDSMVCFFALCCRKKRVIFLVCERERE